jgi:hypothetical protein
MHTHATAGLQGANREGQGRRILLDRDDRVRLRDMKRERTADDEMGEGVKVGLLKALKLRLGMRRVRGQLILDLRDQEIGLHLHINIHSISTTFDTRDSYCHY